MKCVSKKFLAALLACAVAWMAWAPGAAFARAEDGDRTRHEITVTLVNKTNATITVYLSTKYKVRQSSDDTVHGPYSVEPGKKRTVRGFPPGYTFADTPNEYNARYYQHGFYATSSAGRVWAGEKKKGIDVCIFDGYWALKSDIEASSDPQRLKKVKKVVTFRPFLIGKAPQARHEVDRDALGHISAVYGDDYNTTLTFTDKGVSIDTHGNANAQQQKKPAAQQQKKPAAQQQKKPAAQPAKPAKSAVKANAAIRGNRVNIRNAPSLKASVLLQLNNGDTVYATGKTATDSNGDDWYQIKTSSGKTGWVFGRYIDTTSTDKGASMGDQGKTAPQQQKKPAAETFPVTLKNELDQKVFVALTYYDGNAKDWRCRGWWGVEPHKEMNFKLSHVPGKYIYFYVEGNDGKPLTKSGTANGLDWYVTNKKFSYLNGQWENTKLDKPYKGHFVRGSTGDDGWWRLTLN